MEFDGHMLLVQLAQCSGALVAFEAAKSQRLIGACWIDRRAWTSAPLCMQCIGFRPLGSRRKVWIRFPTQGGTYKNIRVFKRRTVDIPGLELRIFCISALRATEIRVPPNSAGASAPTGNSVGVGLMARRRFLGLPWQLRFLHC